MKRPIKPNKDDCCKSGCNPCIFDVYEDQLKLYEKFLKTGDSVKSKENGISHLDYTPFSLIAKYAVGLTHMILVFRKNDSNECKVWWNAGDHFLVKNTYEGNSCSRAYTPLRITRISDTDYDFTIIVKRYADGRVSNYLFSLNIGDKTLWRGPYGFYKTNPIKYSRIVMIAQGTGIAPFISIIEEILNNEEDMTKVVLFFCCPNEGSILLRDELYLYKCYWNFSYRIFLSNTLGNNPKSKYEEPLEGHKLNPNDFHSVKPFTVRDQFLLCGSLLFMQCYEKFLLENNIFHENIILF